MDENIEDMVRERKQITTRIDREYKEIKLICSTYFEKYDNSLAPREGGQVRHDIEEVR